MLSLTPPSLSEPPMSSIQASEDEPGALPRGALSPFTLDAARGQSRFMDGWEGPIATWPDFVAARAELYSSVQWLKSLVDQDPDATSLTAMWDELSKISASPTRAAQEIPRRMFGSGKLELLALCRALERDRRPSTVAVATRALASASGRLSPAAALDVTVGRALDAVRRESPMNAERAPHRPALRPGRLIPSSQLAAAPRPQAPAQAAGPHPLPPTQAANGALASAARTVQDPGERLMGALNHLYHLFDAYGVPSEGALDAFAETFAGVSPTGGQEDPVGDLHLFGLPALERLIQRMAGEVWTENEVRSVLRELQKKLSASQSPVASILVLDRYRLRTVEDAGIDVARADRLRFNSIQSGVRQEAASLLRDWTPSEADRCVRDETMAVMDRLGIDYVVGGMEGAKVHGLIDRSSANLLGLLHIAEARVQDLRHA